MEMLDRPHWIPEDSLSQRYYVQSLVQHACSCGLLSETEISLLQKGLLVILAEQTDKWNRGESSSIPIEKAQDIMSSILFVIGIQLKSYQRPEQAIDMLKSESLNLLFEKGLKQIQRKMMIARHLQKQILKHLLDTPNVYYRSTIADGINGFFKVYRPMFAAHEIHITADYPVCMGRPELDGIEFIETYLRCVQAENEFCVCFASQDIHALLCGLTSDYKRVPLNLFEPVLLSALGLVLCKKSPRRLDLNGHDISFLYQLLIGKSKTEVQECLKKALICLHKDMQVSQRSMRYASLCISKLAVSIVHAVKMKTLDKVFLVPAYPEREPQIVLSYGDRMNDRAYQHLLERIWRADNSREKVQLIMTEVQSLADFLDILSDAELCADDFNRLINMLPLPSLAVLLSQYPNDDFLDRESERLLYQALQKRKSQLSPETRHQIEQMIQAIRTEDR